MTSLFYCLLLFTVGIPVSIILSSLLTAVISTFIFYLIVRKRSYNKYTPPTTTQLGPIYDDVKLPETSEQKEIIELQGNTAYGYIN